MPVAEVQQLASHISQNLHQKLDTILERLRDLEDRGRGRSRSRSRIPITSHTIQDKRPPTAEEQEIKSVIGRALFAVSWGFDWRRNEQTAQKAVFIFAEPSPRIPPQPCQVEGWLVAGDLDAVRGLSSAANPLELNVILYLAPERLDPDEKERLLSSYQRQGVRLEVIAAVDETDGFNMVSPLVYEAAVKICEEVKAKKGRAMIACWGGKNRTAFLSCLLLARLEGVSMMDAIQKMVQRRGRVLTHPPLIRALGVLVRKGSLDAAALQEAHVAAVGWEWCSHFELLVEFAVGTCQYEELRDSHGWTLQDWVTDQSSKHEEDAPWWDEQLKKACSRFETARGNP